MYVVLRFMFIHRILLRALVFVLCFLLLVVATDLIIIMFFLFVFVIFPRALSSFLL